MANNRTITYQVNFKSNEAALKSSMNQLFQTFDKLSDIKVGIDDGSIKQAVSSAQLLEDALFKSFNMDTHKLDMSKFNKELQTSGKNLEELSRDLISMGPQGQQAFQQLAQAVAQADAPIKKTSKLMDDLWFTMQNTMKWKISSSVLDSFTNGLKQAVNYTKDLDKSLNDIRIVTGQSANQMDTFAQKANKAAKQLSSSTLDYTNAALIYYQQGLNDKEVKERTDATIKMANVTGDSAREVSSYMTAVWNNFDDGTKSLEYYADAMTALGAATASSTDEIATGLEKFAGIADTVGLSYEYATSALATLVAETRQSPETVGTALKTIFSRLQGLQLGETLEDGTTLNKYSKALATIGVDIKGQGDSLKSMDQILDEIGAKWQGLAKDQKMALAQTVGGVRQYTQLITLMDNYGDFQSNIDIAKSGEGTLDEQSFLYAQSWEAANERVKASMEGLYQELLDDDFFKGILDFAADFVSGFTKAVDAVGGLAPILTLLSTIIINKMAPNIGQFFSNTISNLSVILGKESERSSLARRTMMDLLQEENLRLGISQATKQQNAAMGNLLSTQESLYQNSKYLSAEQKEWAKGQIDQLGKLSNLINQYSADVSNAGTKINVAKRDAMQSGLGSNANQVFDNFKNINTIQRDLAGQTNQIMNGSISPEQAMGLGGQELDDFYGKVENFNKTTISSFAKAKTSFNEFKKGLSGKAIPPELQARVDALDARFSALTKNVRKTSVSIKQNKNDAQGLSNAYGNLRDNTVEADAIMDEFNNVFKETTVSINSSGESSTRLANSLDQLEQGFNEEAVATDKANQALEAHKKKAGEVQAQIEAWSNGLSATIQKISGFASQATSVLMGIQSFKIWSNEDATLTEKIMGTLMGITMIAPAFVKVFGLLSQMSALRKKQQAVETAADSAEVKSETEKQGLIRLEMGKTQQAVEGINNEKREGLILLDQESGKVTALTKQYQALNAAKRGEIVPVDITTTPGYSELPAPNNALTSPRKGRIIPGWKGVKQLGAGTPRDKSKFIESYAYETMDDGSRKYYTSKGNFSLNRTVGGKSGKYAKRPKGAPAPRTALPAPKSDPVPNPTPTPKPETGKGSGKGLSSIGSYLGVAVAGAAAGYFASQALINTFGNQRDYAKEYDEAISAHAEAQANVQKWQGELQKAYENLDKLKTYLSEVEAANVFEGLTQGTAAWDKKLIETNNATKDLLKSFGMLSSKNYTKDANGLITLTEEAKKEIEEKAKEEQQEAQENLLVAENAEIATNSNKKMAASKNLIAGMNGGVDGGTIGIGIGSGVGAGAAAGALIGSIIPGIGTAVGAGIGAAAGAIAGGIGAIKAANDSSDTKMGEEYEDLAKTLAKTGQTYEEYVNDGGTITESLKNLLGDANLDFDELTVEQQKLREALENNTMALEEAFLAAESTTEEQAYNDLVAQGYDKEIADKAAKIGVNRMTLDVAAEREKLDEQGWGTEGISKATKVNDEARLRAEEYIKAAGLEGAELVDTTGTDKNRKFVFKLEDGSTLEKSVEQMRDVVAQYNASEAAQKMAEAVVSVVNKASNMTGTDGEVAQGIVDYLSAGKVTDDMTIDQITKTQEALTDGTIDQIIEDLGIEDWSALEYKSQEQAVNEWKRRMQLSDGFWDNLDQSLVDTSQLSAGAVNNLNEAVQSLSSGPMANGGDILNGFLEEALAGLDPQQYTLAINHIFDGSINFDDFDAPGKLAAKFDELNLSMDIDSSQWVDFANKLREAGNNIPDFSELINQLTDLQKVLNGLEFGGTVDKETYEKAVGLDPSLQDYFLNVGNGEYKFYGNPDELTNAINKGFEQFFEQQKAADETAKKFEEEGKVAEDSAAHQVKGADGQTGGVYDQGVLNNSSNYSNEDWFDMMKQLLIDEATRATAEEVLAAANYNDPNAVLKQSSINNDEFINKLRGAISDALSVDHGQAAWGGFIDSSKNAANIVKTLPAEALQSEAAQNALLEKAKEAPELYDEILQYINLINQGRLEEAAILKDSIGQLEEQQKIEQEITNFRESAKDSWKIINDPNSSQADRAKAYTGLASDLNNSGMLPANLNFSSEDIKTYWEQINKLLNDTSMSMQEYYDTMTKLQNSKISDTLATMSDEGNEAADYLKSLSLEFKNVDENGNGAKAAFEEFAKITSDGLDMASDTPLQSYHEELLGVMSEASAAKYMLDHFGDNIPKELKTHWEMTIDVIENRLEGKDVRSDGNGNVLLSDQEFNKLGLNPFGGYTKVEDKEEATAVVDYVKNIPEGATLTRSFGKVRVFQDPSDPNVTYHAYVDRDDYKYYDAVTGEELTDKQKSTMQTVWLPDGTKGYVYNNDFKGRSAVREEKVEYYDKNLTQKITYLEETDLGYKWVVPNEDYIEAERAYTKKTTDESEFKKRQTIDINFNGLENLNNSSSSGDIEFGESPELAALKAQYEDIGTQISNLDTKINLQVKDEDVLKSLQKRIDLRNDEKAVLEDMLTLQKAEKKANELSVMGEDGTWANTIIGIEDKAEFSLAEAVGLQVGDKSIMDYLANRTWTDPITGDEFQLDLKDGIDAKEAAALKELQRLFNNDIALDRATADKNSTSKFSKIDKAWEFILQMADTAVEQQNAIDQTENKILDIEQKNWDDELAKLERSQAPDKRKREIENKETEQFMSRTDKSSDFAFARLKKRIQQATNAQEELNDAQERFEKIEEAVKNGLASEEELHKAKIDVIEAENKVLDAQRKIYSELSKAIENYKKDISDLNSEGDHYIKMIENFGSILENLDTQNSEMIRNLDKVTIDMMGQNLINIRSEISGYKQIVADLTSALRIAKLTGDEAQIAEIEGQLEAAEKNLKDSEAKLISELNNTLEKIGEVYEKNIDSIVKKWSEAAAGLMVNMDALEDAFDKEKELSEQYLDKETQIYELEKLRRTINKDLAGNQNLIAVQKLESVLEDINEIQARGLEMSDYDLKILQAKYDLRKAEIELEEAQNNKSEVRLMRNSQGNWTYVFTANQEAIADAEQKVADEREKISNESQEYLQEVQENLIKMEKERQEAIADAYKEHKDDEVALQKEVTRINAYYTKQFGYYGSEMEKVLDILGIDFKDTSYAALTGYKDMDEAQSEFIDNGKNAIRELDGAYEEFQSQIATTFQNAGMNYETFVTDLENKYVPSITTAMGNIVDEIEKKTKEALIEIAKMIEEIEKELNKSNPNFVGYANADYNGIVENPEAFGGSGWVSVGKEGPGSVNVASNGNLVPSDNNTSVVVNGEALPPGMVATTSWLRGAAQGATGMYTGEWGPEGKLAVLHEKELVLNKMDTKNILSAVEIMRQLINSANYSRLSLGNRYYVPTAQGVPTKEKLEQNVHVEASFPGVQSALEIETALNNIVNDVSQYIQKK